MKQVRVLDNVHAMLVEVVADEKKSGNLGATKQSVVNELILNRHKKIKKASLEKCAKK